LSRIIMFLLED